MSKPRVERAPIFDISATDLAKIQPYIGRYDVTDDKGRYLHWDQLKWRVPHDEAKLVWQAVKMKRMFQMKRLPLQDESGDAFMYCIPHSMEAMLHEIVRIAGGHIGAIGASKASDNIQNKFLVSALIMEEAITSAQLEGASTTREVAKKMLEEEREPKDEDERMILNNYLLLRYAEQNKSEELSIDMILEFHRIATQHTTENNVTPGEFRKDNDIFVEDGHGGIAHMPPDHKVIQPRLIKLCEFANSAHTGIAGCEFIAPVIKAIVLHFMLGYEHPFRDGNGRTARALFYWYMLKCDYTLFKYVSISRLIKERPKDYGISFMYSERDQNDLTYFIYFQLKVILSAFEELKSYLQNKTEEFQRVTELLNSTDFEHQLNFIQKDIIKKATKEPGRIFTAREISNSYSISENTARSHLNKLVEMKLFYNSKDGRTVLYIAPSDLVMKIKSGRKIAKSSRNAQQSRT